MGSNLLIPSHQLSHESLLKLRPFHEQVALIALDGHMSNWFPLLLTFYLQPLKLSALRLNGGAQYGLLLLPYWRSWPYELHQASSLEPFFSQLHHYELHRGS